ncbi:RICIN domain-containing protein [Streptomyces sp. SLBN-118]|uniref:RICIN domain-containing protein n=1 Tax=Streptomyces sp. SLBN-118 TaxID=2768454 RepID=UPI00135CDA1B|nr:RICIN domain-containing protein [Streptomyces sp. SLBN-118]
MGALLIAGGTTAVGPSAQAAVEICDRVGTAKLAGGEIIVQNNRWGADTTQCISADGTGFRITRADHNNPTNGVPAGYPSVYKGCHYGNCSANSGLPLKVSDFGDPRATYDISTPDSGEWNASFDLWFDANPNPSGQNYGAELMIWANHRGRPQPIGSKMGTAWIEGANWDVWIGNIGWNVISYVRQQPTNLLDNVSIKAFTHDAANRGQINGRWYMTSVQAGFEPWVGGTDLAVKRFAFTANGGGGGGGGVGAQKIVNSGSNRCVDVENWGTRDGAALQLWDCSGDTNQRWQPQGEALVNPVSGKCLDVQGGGTANGTRVHLWSCSPGNGAQRWVRDANGKLRNPQSGKCLDAVERGTANGTALQIWDCGGGSQPQQQWRFEN